MSFFKMLTWDNGHMDLRYTEDSYDGSVKITNVYRDNRALDYEEVNDKYAPQIKSAQGTIRTYRIAMLILFIGLVFFPAVVIGVVQNNVLLVGAIVVYAVVAYFLVEAYNQTIINSVLYEMDKDLTGGQGTPRQIKK